MTDKQTQTFKVGDRVEWGGEHAVIVGPFRTVDDHDDTAWVLKFSDGTMDWDYEARLCLIERDGQPAPNPGADVPSVSADERRERVATAAMQGMFAGEFNPLVIPEMAVKAADALIAELDKTDA